MSSTRILVPLLVLSLATGCSGGGGGGGSGGGGGGTVITPTPTPTPAPGPAPSPTPTPVSTEPATGADFASSIALLYAVQPNIGACQPGQLNPEVGATVLASLNAIRALHALPPVSYAPADESGEMQASLMMAANGQISHTPPTSWSCYNSAGATAAGQSNLYIGLGSGLRYTRNEDLVIGWLTDVDNLVMNNVGHRRWLLYPFLSTIAYGRVAGSTSANPRVDAASIKVINTAQASPASLPDFVAYPYQDYPARYYASGALLSFGVIANKSSAFGANASVDFSHATITVTRRGGAALAVTNVSFDNDGYGLPNNLQWSVSGLAANTYYDVTINGVVVSGATRNYSYYFRLV